MKTNFKKDFLKVKQKISVSIRRELLISLRKRVKRGDCLNLSQGIEHALILFQRQDKNSIIFEIGKHKEKVAQLESRLKTSKLYRKFNKGHKQKGLRDYS